MAAWRNVMQLRRGEAPPLAWLGLAITAAAAGTALWRWTSSC